ncbi:MAG: DUF4417 domain-containing protein [Candidatus Contendobacter sp.]|nr:DUF4417 domain-containing protein [Candidatus Contendobacter sp.]MDG4558866.1 DUF4417 domain-containing protein [Candidatus Contendobacter sp.]
MTRSSHNWQRAPGHYDVLHIRRRCYPSGNHWGFPDLLPQRFDLTTLKPLMSYRERDDAGERQAQAIAHFFLDDYRFESVWTKPDQGLSKVRRFWAVLTPDFSLYADWPPIVQQWNHYRRQWLGRYWQEHGLRVIPTANWSTPDSFDWCFAGIPTGQIVALAVPDLRNPITRVHFEAGYRTLQNALAPARILVYGRLPVELHTDAVQEFPPDWQRLRKIHTRRTHKQTR